MSLRRGVSSPIKLYEQTALFDPNFLGGLAGRPLDCAVSLVEEAGAELGGVTADSEFAHYVL